MIRLHRHDWFSLLTTKEIICFLLIGETFYLSEKLLVILGLILSTNVIFLPGLRLMQAGQTYSRVSTFKHTFHCKKYPFLHSLTNKGENALRESQQTLACECRNIGGKILEEMLSFLDIGIRFKEHKEFSQRAWHMTRGMLPFWYNYNTKYSTMQNKKLQLYNIILNIVEFLIL